MEIIKEHVTKHNLTRLVIRTNTYANSFAHFTMLSNIAKADFAPLANDEIKVVQYAGERYPNTYGIQFVLPDVSTIPSDYVEIAELESIL